jgi:hypothetical protein
MKNLKMCFKYKNLSYVLFWVVLRRVEFNSQSFGACCTLCITTRYTRKFLYSWFQSFAVFKCCMFSFGLFFGVWSLIANVSEHSVCSIFIGEWGMKFEVPTRLWRWDRQSVPQRWLLNSTRQRTTRKKTYNI